MQETTSNIKSRWLIKYAPVLLIDIYIGATLLLFKFGLIRWHINRANLVLLYITAVYAVFTLGYFFVGAVYKAKPLLPTQERALITYARVVIAVGVIVGVVYNIGWICYTFKGNALLYLRYPGAAYDYAKYVQRAALSGKMVFPMEFRWITRFNTVAGGAIALVIPLGIVIFDKLSLWEKAGVILFGVTYILISVLQGLQSQFLIFFMLIIVGSVSRTTAYCYKNKDASSKEKRWRILQSVAIVTVSVFMFAGVMLVFQKDRRVQRDIRTGLNKTTFELCTKASPEQLENNVLRSIEIRLGKRLFNISRVDEIKKEQEQQTVPQVQQGQGGATAHQQEKAPEQDNRTALQKSYKELSKYFTEQPVKKLREQRPGVVYGVQFIEMYLTQGYAALGLAFNQPFEWTYGIGSVKFICQKLDALKGTRVFERTYVYKNEANNGWSVQTYYHSAYTWLASDWTFFGVIIFFGLLGMAFAKVWLDTIARGNPIGSGMVYLVVISVLFATAGNVSFQTLGSFITSWEIIFIYFVSLILINKNKGETIL